MNEQYQDLFELILRKEKESLSRDASASQTLTKVCEVLVNLNKRITVLEKLTLIGKDLK